MIRDMRRDKSFQPGKRKAVYIAPMRSLVSERKADWQSRFRSLGLRTVELSGDSIEKEGMGYMQKVSESDIIITTPEKLDSVSRRFTAESKSLLASITLLMVDEIHLLADDRGAVLESIVTRIKRLSQHDEVQNMPVANLRIIAASATLPNLNDIATWLSTPLNKCEPFAFGEEYRPCPLQLHVHGVSSFRNNDFLFDKNIHKELPDIVRMHNDGRPSLVFCNT